MFSTVPASIDRRPLNDSGHTFLDRSRRHSGCVGENVLCQGEGQQQLPRAHHGLLLLGLGGGSLLGMAMVSWLPVLKGKGTDTF